MRWQGLANGLKIPASGTGDLKTSDVRQLDVQRGHQFLRFFRQDIELLSVNQSQSVLIKVQMHRVGTEPARSNAPGSKPRFAQSPESRAGSVRRVSEPLTQRMFQGERRATIQSATRQQGFQGGGCRIIGRRPRQVGDEQGDVHE